MPELDFGFNGNVTSTEETVEKETKEDVVDIDNDKVVDDKGNPNTDINEVDDNANKDTKDTKEDKDKPEDKEKDDDRLEEGTVVEYGDKKYTVDKDGNLLKEDGSVFKKADKVNDWLKSLETEETTSAEESKVDVKAIQKILGAEIVDESGKPVEFENNADGLASYVRSYIESTQNQIREATIDALYNKYPILENVINYYVANGNSLEGFNELRDRSKITLDTENEAQCEAIIREAWKEDNRRGNVDSYIQYLKSQQILGATAEEELAAMVAKDKAASEELARKAKETEENYIKEQKAYWGDIQKRVTVDKKIGKYQIPETIIRVRDGKKISATPADFFNYIYQVDKEGHSMYERDLERQAKENPESRVVDDMLNAYLKFTGGSYESLVNMAINEKEVKIIKIKSKAASHKAPARITKPTNKPKEIDFGY